MHSSTASNTMLDTPSYVYPSWMHELSNTKESEREASGRMSERVMAWSFVRERVR